MWDDWKDIEVAQREADQPRDVVVPASVERAQGAPQATVETPQTLTWRASDRWMEAQEKTRDLRGALMLLRVQIHRQRLRARKENPDAD